MKTWFKNGCWGIVTAAILALVLWIVLIVIYNPDFSYWAGSLFFIFSLPGGIILLIPLFLMFGYYPPQGFTDLFYYVLITAFSIGIYFLLGILVGWVIKKIKK